MRLQHWLIGCSLVLALVLPAVPADSGKVTGSAASEITWKKTVLDKEFRSEGVAVADVNKDGKMDILTGEVWYEAPDWKPHEIRKPGKDYTRRPEQRLQQQLRLLGRGPQRRRLARPDRHRLPRQARATGTRTPRARPATGRSTRSGTAPATRRRSTSTCSAPASASWSWAGSPRARTTRGRWPSSPPARTRRSCGRCTRSASRAPRARTIPGTHQLLARPGRRRRQRRRPARRDLHRRLVGAAGQGRRQAVEVPPRRTSATPAPTCSPTTWTATARPTSSAARPTSSASGGTSRSRRKDGDPTFLKHDLFPKLVSQTHALHFVDINGDGLKDLVTGKRWWAHGPKGDADPNAPADALLVRGQARHGRHDARSRRT